MFHLTCMFFGSSSANVKLLQVSSWWNHEISCGLEDCVSIKSITLCNCLSASCSSTMQLFWNIGKCGAKKYFTDNKTAKTTQLYVTIKRKFSEQVAAIGNSSGTT